MSKKIIFLGPPGAGKTTLRKIFFEGESATQLLEYALEPTHGQESIVLKFREEIGIFDLAGQENQFWLELNKESVFLGTEVIIIIVDVTSPIEEILNFAKKVIRIRDELTPNSIAYLLVHKIDLIDKNELRKLDVQINNTFFKENLLKIAFTSIKKEYFMKTFTLFIDILKTCISKEIVSEKIDLKLFNNVVNVMYSIDKESPMSKKNLQDILKIPDQNLDLIINLLENQNYIEISRNNHDVLIKLSDKGSSYLNQLLTNFSPEDFNKIEETNLEGKVKDEEKFYPFLGFIISDKEGKTLMDAEIYNNLFKSLLKIKKSDESLDHELIPLFICALEKFSGELNIKNLPGFSLKGTNVRIETFNFNLITITLFMNSNTNMKSMKTYIKEWFMNLLETNKTDIDYSIETGDVTKVSKLKREGKEWLENLNKKYKVMALNSEIFDIKQTRELYQKLEDIKLDQCTPKVIKQVKNLKMDLIRASLEEDVQAIKKISKKANELLFIL